MLLPEGVDVCNDPCVSQVQKCVIYNGAIDCRGVKKGQLRIAWSIPIEVRMGKGSGM